MCGIIGLLIKDPTQLDRLGEWMRPMVIGMTERGPDSAGIALYRTPLPDTRRKFSVVGVRNGDALIAELSGDVPGRHEIAWRQHHAIVETDALHAPGVAAWLQRRTRLTVLAMGRAIDLYKDVGRPGDIVDRFGLGAARGTHVVGHTRMATESAVTPQNAHPYTAGEDFCLVHNGSLSNPYSLRRELERRGIRFDGDCDTEAACRWLEWRMREGDDLHTALTAGLREFDGFYTFLMGTQDSLALLRDPFACKPAIVAETDAYVAIASEFRALAHLPDIGHAQVFEPRPEHIYVWRVPQAEALAA